MERLGEGVRKLILAGIGAAAVTKQRSEEILHDLVKTGELTVEQGRVLNEELKHSIKEALWENTSCAPDGGSEELIDKISDLDEDQLEELKKCITIAEQRHKDSNPPEHKEPLDNDQD